MLRLLQDTAGLGACKMMRRVIGLAGVVDIRGIEDPTDKSIAASLALNIGQALIMNRHEVRQIEDIVEIAKGESPTYPWTD
jgi:5-methylthioribose kinase